MNVFLRQLATQELGPHDPAIVIMDQARWHKSETLKVPERITILLLPPYSPELNPVERVWAYMRSHHLVNCACADYDAIVKAGAESWRSLTPELRRSIRRCEHLERGEYPPTVSHVSAASSSKAGCRDRHHRPCRQR